MRQIMLNVHHAKGQSRVQKERCLQFMPSRPSVYLSFILETQADTKWINKDWAKNWQWVCLFCGACWPPLCADSQSVSADWLTERGSKAGRTLMGVMLMSSKPINMLSLPLPSPLISSLVCLTPSQVRWGEFRCVARKPHTQIATEIDESVLKINLK